MKNLFLIIKGFFIGIANIIPGVSGGTLMISLGIYEDVIDAISNFFKNFKKNIILLALLGIGTLISLVLMSRVVTYSLENFKLPTIIFFVGLILGGIPMLFKKVKHEKKSISNILFFIITFSIIMFMTFANGSMQTANFSDMNLASYLILVGIGIIAAASMVIPGISGSFLLIFLGYYEPILNTIKDLTSFNNVIDNLLILSSVAIGALIGIILVAKLIEFLFKKFEVKTYYAILGFVLSSVVSIIATAFQEGITVNAIHIVIAIITFIIGFITAYKLGE